jgi:hypothetical protein
MSEKVELLELDVNAVYQASNFNLHSIHLYRKVRG